MTACHYCGSINAETRPYGPRGERVCFACAFASPERAKQTETAFAAQLDASGPIAVIGEEAGPYPLSKETRS